MREESGAKFLHTARERERERRWGRRIGWVDSNTLPEREREGGAEDRVG